MIGAGGSTIYVLYLLEFYAGDAVSQWCDTRWVEGPEAEIVEVTLADGAVARGRNANLVNYASDVGLAQHLLVADDQGFCHMAYSAGPDSRAFGSAMGEADGTTVIIDFESLLSEDGPQPLPEEYDEWQQTVGSDVFAVVSQSQNVTLGVSSQGIRRIPCVLTDSGSTTESTCPPVEACQIIKSDFNSDGFDDIVHTNGNEARITYVDGASSASAHISTNCPVTDLVALDINGDYQQDIAYIDRSFGGSDDPKSVLKIAYGTSQGPSSSPEVLGYIEGGSLIGGAFSVSDPFDTTFTTATGPQDLFVVVDEPSGAADRAEGDSKVRGALFKGSLWSAPTAPIFFALEDAQFEQEGEQNAKYLSLASPQAFAYGRFAESGDEVLSGLAVLTNDPLWFPENEEEQEPWLLWRLQKRQTAQGLAAFLEDASGEEPTTIAGGASLPVAIDVDGDGIDEVALFAGNSVSVYRAGDQGFEPMPDAEGADGLEYFFGNPFSDYPFQYASKPRVVDLDDDSHLDILIRPDFSSALVAYFGDGEGGFEEHVVTPEDLEGSFYPYFGFAAADLDVDPRLEIIVYRAGEWQVFALSEPGRSYEQSSILAEQAFGGIEDYWLQSVFDATEVFVADLDLDGIDDVVVAGWSGFVTLRGRTVTALESAGETP